MDFFTARRYASAVYAEDLDEIPTGSPQTGTTNTRGVGKFAPFDK